MNINAVCYRVWWFCRKNLHQFLCSINKFPDFYPQVI
jgi:hypothetical protein